MPPQPFKKGIWIFGKKLAQIYCLYIWRLHSNNLLNIRFRYYSKGFVFVLDTVILLWFIWHYRCSSNIAVSARAGFKITKPNHKLWIRANTGGPWPKSPNCFISMRAEELNVTVETFLLEWGSRWEKSFELGLALQCYPKCNALVYIMYLYLIYIFNYIDVNTVCDSAAHGPCSSMSVNIATVVFLLSRTSYMIKCMQYHLVSVTKTQYFYYSQAKICWNKVS